MTFYFLGKDCQEGICKFDVFLKKFSIVKKTKLEAQSS